MKKSSSPPQTSLSTLAQTSEMSVVLKRLWGYLMPHLWAVLCAILAMGLVAASEAGIPALLKPLLDQGFGVKDHASQLKRMIPLAVISLALVRGVAQYASNYLLAWMSNKILLTLRLQMFERVLQASATFFQRETASTLINAMVFEVSQVLNALTNVMVTLLRDSLTVIFLLGYLLYLNWRLTLVVALILPVIGWLVGRINRRLRRLNREHQMLTNELSYIVEETVGGYKVVKVHNGEPYELQRFTNMSNRLRGYSMRMTIFGGLAQPLTQFLASFALAIVITLAVLQSAADQTTVGGFVAFVTSMLLIISPLKHLIDVNQPLQRGVTAAELIFGLIDEPMIEPKGGTQPLLHARGKIEFRQVHFSYRELNDKTVTVPFNAPSTMPSLPTLAGISLVIEPGEMVALVGPSGSGKSTLVSLLPRFFDTTGGQILLDDVALNDYQLADLRRQIAFVGQDVVLFHDSIAANVAYGRRDGEEIDRSKVEQALAGAYLTEMVAALPDGMDTLVGKNGTRLSGGQRQRLAIARAIYKNAPILILDEATSALDAESERHVQAALETLMQGRTTLVVAHRLSTIERADRIIVLDAGQIVEQGSHAELLSKQGLYAHLYQLQS